MKYMEKLPYPFSHYYKSIKEEKCPFCRSGNITQDAIWCDEKGAYITIEARETYARGGNGQCKHCTGIIFRHTPDGLTYICEDCKKVINFKKDVMYR
jgi:hypothetical protein